MSGYAVMERHLIQKELSQVGQWAERWRFKHDTSGVRAPRAEGLAGLDPLKDLATVRPLLDGEVGPFVTGGPDLPEVPFSITNRSCWKC